MRDRRSVEQGEEYDEARAPSAQASDVVALQRRWGNNRLVQLRRVLQRQGGRGETPGAGSGLALPAPLQRMAEAQLGTSLDGVTITHGADAACDSIGALAFTTPGDAGGHTVALSSAVDLDDEEGRFTLLHELAHVAQQRRGDTAALSGLGGDEATRDQLERDADAVAARALAGGRVG